jgi:hypothetical protein
MRVMKPLLMVLCLGAAVLCAPLAAKADDWNKETSLTFNKPVEIPGMVLAPGTYIFKLLDSPADRSVVQIFNADESHLYKNVLAIPAYRLETTDTPAVTFEERSKGTPEAVKDWFYPGDNYGQEFVYPEIHTATVAGLSAQQPTVTSGTAFAPPQPRTVTATPESSPGGAALQASCVLGGNNGSSSKGSGEETSQNCESCSGSDSDRSSVDRGVSQRSSAVKAQRLAQQRRGRIEVPNVARCSETRFPYCWCRSSGLCRRPDDGVVYQATL